MYATRCRCLVTVAAPRGRKLVVLSSGDGLTRPGMWDAVSACQAGRLVPGVAWTVVRHAKARPLRWRRWTWRIEGSALDFPVTEW